ncbi:MAG: 50S ribosomal protein L15 [Armatimonadota bacterium]|nr:50S ribosomal protein L15 [Armatimonadota bacterium]MDR5697108.1 50S ribosomal protein L15 [Armatimonadota bacterium]
MRIDGLAPPAGSKRRRRRVGRGHGSGRGTYAGRGVKGQKARSGKGPRAGFEGGQTPLGKRLPFARGVRAYGSVHTGGRPRPGYVEVNLRDLARFEPGSEVTPERLRSSGVVSRRGRIKILAKGTLDRALVVKAHAFSAAARAAIEAKGGTVEVIG